MNLKNSRNWSTVPRSVAYPVSIGLTLLAFAACYALSPHVQPFTPHKLFVVSCLLAEYLFGLGPALLAMGLGLGLDMYYFIPPYSTFDGYSHIDLYIVTNFLLFNIFAIGLIEYLRRALYSNQLLLKVSRSRLKTSLYRENERLYFSRKAIAASGAVETLIGDLDKVLLIQGAAGSVSLFPAFYRLSGLPLQAERQADWINAVHPDDRQLLLGSLAQPASTAKSSKCIPIRLTNGTHEIYRQVDVMVAHVQMRDLNATVLKLTQPMTGNRKSDPKTMDDAISID